MTANDAAFNMQHESKLPPTSLTEWDDGMNMMLSSFLYIIVTVYEEEGEIR